MTLVSLIRSLLSVMSAVQNLNQASNVSSFAPRVRHIQHTSFGTLHLPYTNVRTTVPNMAQPSKRQRLRFAHALPITPQIQPRCIQEATRGRQCRNRRGHPRSRAAELVAKFDGMRSPHKVLALELQLLTISRGTCEPTGGTRQLGDKSPGGECP